MRPLLRALLATRRTLNRWIAALCTACPSTATIAAYVDGNLSPTEVDEFQEHISGCDRCTEITLGAFELLDELRNHEPERTP